MICGLSGTWSRPVCSKPGWLVTWTVGALLFRQDAGLIDSIEPAGLIVERLVAEAEQMLRERLSGLLTNQPEQLVSG